MMAALLAVSHLPSSVILAEEADSSEAPAAEELIAETEETAEEAEETAVTAEVTETEEIPEEAAEEETALPEETSETDGTEESTEIAPAATYEEFLAALKTLETYAKDYAVANSKDSFKVMVSYIRTGYPKYTDGNWTTLAGEEDTAFTAYVAEMDEQNSTQAQAVRNTGVFTLPNGTEAEFTHMFGALDIALTNHSNSDFGSWLGDLVDLLEYSKYLGVSGSTIDELASNIRQNVLGVDDPDHHSFGILDLYGDLDMFYLYTMIQEGETSLSEIVEDYYTAALTDTDRAVFFVKNRFPGVTEQDELRTSVYELYASNNAATVLESSRGITSDDSDLRYASCYAFADYLFSLADGYLASAEESNDYYTVFSTSKQKLAPGVTQTIKYATTADNKQLVYYIASADVTRDDVMVQANYNNYDPTSWGMSRVSDMLKAAKEKHTNPDDPDNYIENYDPIVGTNGDFYNMSTGVPSGALVMSGVEYHGAGSENFFAILKDGTPIIGTASEYAQYEGEIQEAIGGGAYLVKNGAINVGSSSTYYNNRASRTCVGITADNKVIMVVIDGRQEPFSCGAASQEMAQIMYEAGCVTAINLDGGGSTTFVAKEEGADEISVVNSPSDGFERSVSSGLMIVTTAVKSTAFDHILISAESDYLTYDTTVSYTLSGVSVSGNSAQIPEGVTLTLSDDSMGTLDTENGTFTAQNYGDVTISAILNDAVVGKKTLHIVDPDGITFTKSSINVVYGVPTVMPVKAYYGNHEVAINENDLFWELSPDTAGVAEGFEFTGDESSGVRIATATAYLAADGETNASIAISLFREDEASFDFDNATENNGTVYWNRDVSNSTSLRTDEGVMYYHIVDPNEPMEASYTFALSMENIEIPEQLQPLMSMIPGGDDTEKPAWEFLLQLAERVSILTEVKIDFIVDENMDVDCSNLTLSNEYFSLTSAEFDEETRTLSVKFNWNDQTQEIAVETANPVCILSGFKMTPKDGAAWDENNCLNVLNVGTLTYDIYLRASALYAFACNEANQEKYGLYPYDNPNPGHGTVDKGGHFYNEYTTFEDKYILDQSVSNGWVQEGANRYYYENNERLTGIQYLPAYDEEGVSYYYEFDENGVLISKVSGLLELDGKLFLLANGVKKAGWQSVKDDDGTAYYYYFTPGTAEAVDGEQTIGGYTYTFENYRLVKGQIVRNGEYLQYRWAGQWYANGWFIYEGKKYCAGASEKLKTGIVAVDGYNQDGVIRMHWFDDDGVWHEEYNGIYDKDGKSYYVTDGIVNPYPGVVLVDGNYYYISSNDILIKDRSYWVSKTNDLVKEKSYVFDENGVMQVSEEDIIGGSEEPDPQTEVKNGIVAENDSLWYYVNDVLTYAGVIIIDGNYYYVKTSGEVVHGRNYWVTKTNDLVKEKSYVFDENGVMTVTDADKIGSSTEVKNGIVAENDSLWYYVDGKLSYAGVIIIDGNYYYVKTSGEVVHGRSYWVTKTNNLVKEKSYVFDENGVMTVTEADKIGSSTEVKNGIVAENDSLWYYVDGVITYAGVIIIDGNYYYVKTSGEVVHGKSYWITKTNGLVKEKSYVFDENGVMTVTDADKLN